MTSHLVEYNAAQKLGRRLHPEASDAAHMVFGNAMTYGILGFSAIFGCLTPRTSRARQILLVSGVVPGRRSRLTREQVTKLVEATCYGPMTRDIAEMVLSPISYSASSKVVVAEVDEARRVLNW